LKHKKLVIGIIVVVVAIGYLGWVMVKNFMTTNYDVTTFLSKQASLINKTVRVGGEVLPGVQRNTTLSNLSFTIADKTNLSNSLKVSYSGGIVPDAFKEGGDVIVEGKYTSSGVFQATSLITKCPSKYTVAPANTNK
jgi:cytochrome c-type biogenesis protein CcmE